MLLCLWHNGKALDSGAFREQLTDHSQLITLLMSFSSAERLKYSTAERHTFSCQL